MRHINFKDSFILHLYFAEGRPRGDWRARLASSGGGYYEASCIGGEYTNAVVASDYTIKIIVENHSLGMGALNCELVEVVPFDGSTGKAPVHEFPKLDICLWAGETDVDDIVVDVESAYYAQQIIDGYWSAKGINTGGPATGPQGIPGEGVPAGGRTGQVLKKKSDGDYDTAWGEDEGITDIAPGAVGTAEIADNAVTKGKIGAGAVVADKIAEGAVSRSKLDTDLASRGVRKAWMVNLLYSPSPSGVYKDVTPSEWRAVAGGTVDFTPLDKMVKEAAKAGDFIMNGSNTSYIVLQHIVGLVGGNELHRFVLVRQFASGSQPNTETGISSYQLECVLYDYTPKTNTLKAMSLILRDAFNDYKSVGGVGNRQKLFETIRDLVDEPISPLKIAEKAVTLPKLGDDVVAKLNGYASKEDVAAVAAVATSAASVAADAQTLADDAADAATAAGNVAETAKETAESALTAASGAVRFDAAQGLTPAQQELVSNNVGVPTVFFDNSELGKVLSEQRAAQVNAATRIIVADDSISGGIRVFLSLIHI